MGERWGVWNVKYRAWVDNVTPDGQPTREMSRIVADAVAGMMRERCPDQQYEVRHHDDAPKPEPPKPELWGLWNRDAGRWATAGGRPWFTSSKDVAESWIGFVGLSYEVRESSADQPAKPAGVTPNAAAADGMHPSQNSTSYFHKLLALSSHRESVARAYFARLPAVQAIVARVGESRGVDVLARAWQHETALRAEAEAKAAEWLSVAAEVMK